MRSLACLALSIALAALGACGEKNSPSRGSFVREDPLGPGLVTRLHVTPTGLTVTTPSLTMSTSGSLDVGGEPLFKGSTRMEVGLAAQGAALFSKLTCSDDTCTFTTKSGCEGTLTADAKGNVVLIATGECAPWSGKWLSESDAPSRPTASTDPTCPPPAACPPTATCPPPAACPPSAACPPCGSAAPPTPGPTASASASAEPPSGAHTGMQCMTECNHTQTTCVQQCRIGDSSCMHQCSSTVMTCVERCR